MKSEIIEAMENFSKRVLKGGTNATQQEVAILPQILEILMVVKESAKKEKEEIPKKEDERYGNLEHMISDFAKHEKEEAQKALASEANIVCINPESYIAKEIKYQTALMHEILREIRERGR